jgi:hypothetical protein
MPIPELSANGYLPPGVHDATLEEVGAVFGRFQRSDRRVFLFLRLCDYVRELRAWGRAEELLIDGSFVSGKAEPNDVDLIVVYPNEFDSRAALNPAEYNVMSTRRVRAGYGFDAFPVRARSKQWEDWLEYFSRDTRVGLGPKGIMRLRL